MPPYDQYGAVEMCVFVAQCTKGKYHVHSDYGIIEFINEYGKPACPGETAELVCTGLINPVMPLIRYRIGDLGVLSDDNCDCGNPFPIMKELIGRTEDTIITPEGNKISRLGRVIYDFPIKEIQYIQNSKKSLKILIVKDVSYTFKDEQHLIKELRKRLGAKIAIDINHVDKIERNFNNKFKTVLSNLDK